MRPPSSPKLSRALFAALALGVVTALVAGSVVALGRDRRSPAAAPEAADARVARASQDLDPQKVGLTTPEGLRTPDDGTGPITLADTAAGRRASTADGRRPLGESGADGAPTTPSPRAGQSDTAFVPRELIVRFDPSTPEHQRAETRRRHNLTKLQDLAMPGLELVRVNGSADPGDQADLVGAERGVRYAEPNYVWTSTAATNDPAYPYLWGFENRGDIFTGSVADADGDVTEGLDRAVDTSNIIVAVIDEGVDTTHADLAANMWINAAEANGTPGHDDDANGYVDDIHGWDFVHNDASVFDAADGDDHGTHVAGTIAAVSNNGLGVAGVSQAKIMALKFLGADGTGSTAAAVNAIEYAIRNGAHITSNSWGGGGESRALAEKIQQAGEAGLLFVAAAGNGGEDGASDNNDAPGWEHFPSSYQHPSVLAVAATTPGDLLTSFSNYGATSVDVGAPGSSILSAVPGRNTKAVLSNYGAGKAALHTFGLEGVIDPADRAAVITAALGNWAGMPTSSSVLLVDDDWYYGFEVHHRNALHSAGYTSVTTSAQVDDCANGPSVAGYDVVVWITNSDYLCTLTATDRAALTTYVNNGGVLLLFGQSIAEDLAGSTFMSAVLKASFSSYTDHDYGLVGAPSTPYAGIDLRLTGTGDARQLWSNTITALPGGVAAVKGTGPLAYYAGTSMATPFVTGIAVHLLAKFPGMRATHIKERIMETGETKAALVDKTVSGKRVNLDRALATGTLSGTVTAENGGASLAGICVTAWSNPTGAYAKSTTTDGAGAYSLTLPTDDYTVQFRDCRPTPTHAAEFNGNAADWAAAKATALTVADGATSTADAALADGGTMSGTVTDGSAALSGICVSAFTPAGTWVGSARTGSGGAWSIGGFGSGDYQVRFTDCTRTATDQYATHWYNGAADRTTGYSLVAVAAGAPTTGVNAALPRSGRISGTVAADAGGALGYICVSATTPDGHFIQRVKTASNGGFTVGGMGTGSFLLYFSDCSGLGYTAEWWQNAATLGTATTIAVTAGSTTTIGTATLS